MCSHCNKCTADSHICDQFLIGLTSPCMQRDLTAEDNSLDTPEKMVNRATQLEVVASDQNILSTQSSGPPSSEQAHAILLAEIKVNGEVHEITIHATPDIDGDGKFQSGATCRIKVFSDSGAGICLGNANHAKALGLQIDSLTECYKRVKAVGGSTIICRCVIPVQFSIDQHVTVRNVYFTYTKLSRMYLSRKGCLG